MIITELIAGFFLLTGIFFFFTATIGLLRLPDFYSRLHATGKGDTLAVLFSLVGLAIYEGLTITSIKILLIAVFVFLAQPTATHAISRAAFRCHIQPYTQKQEH